MEKYKGGRVNIGKICGFFRLMHGSENRASGIENRAIFDRNT